jgi:glycosyltransferase involved in cell wall biosynthesis
MSAEPAVASVEKGDWPLSLEGASPLFQPLGLSLEFVQWLAEFGRTRGRRPRILHIGNIANNAYLNAKFLNRAGFDCDVICADYYHVMSCPEWEDADYRGDIRNDLFPAWPEVDIGDFERPRWFAQGPTIACLEYLLARRERPADADKHWSRLLDERDAECAIHRGEIRLVAAHSSRRMLAGKAIRKFWKLPYLAAQRSAKLRWLAMSLGSSPFMAAVRRACQRFAELFPDREDRLRPIEFETFAYSYPLWTKLLGHYDLAVGYATNGVFPMLAGVPYVAFEHGTIRNIPFEPTTQGRLCALVYRLAGQTFITNCDSQQSAERLGLKRYRFVPHPINEDPHPTADPAAIRRDLRAKLASDFIVFHPARQHWSVERDTSWDKGNDILIEGFARFVREVNPKAGAVFVEWGQTLQQSKNLLSDRGIADRVLWIAPQPASRMNAHVAACDALADQFCIGAFGSTMPRGLMLGTPNLIYLNESAHRWCMPEMPPVLNTRTPDDVFAALKRLYQDPNYSRQVADAGKAWYAKYHSSRVVADAFAEAVRELPLPAQGGAP